MLAQSNGVPATTKQTDHRARRCGMRSSRHSQGRPEAREG